jgi:hypothetical protein
VRNNPQLRNGSFHKNAGCFFFFCSTLAAVVWKEPFLNLRCSHIPTTTHRPKIVHWWSTAQSLKFLGLTIVTTVTSKHKIGDLTSRLNKACFAITSIKSFMSLDVLRSTYFSNVHSIISYGIIFWGSSSHSEEIFKNQKRIIRIIINSSKNVSCQQLFKHLNILPIQSQYMFSIHLFLTKNKDQFLTHKDIKSIQGKLLICKYLQQTWQYTKKVFITRELRFTIIYQQPLTFRHRTSYI